MSDQHINVTTMHISSDGADAEHVEAALECLSLLFDELVDAGVEEASLLVALAMSIEAIQMGEASNILH